MTTYEVDPRVDDYIASLPGWQQDLCRQVRDLVHTADRDVIETIKRSRQPYFVLDGNICALLGARDHLNVFIYDPIAPDPESIINQGHGNLTARTIQIRQDETINERALLSLFKAVIANNRAGGWRKVQRGNWEEFQRRTGWAGQPRLESARTLAKLTGKHCAFELGHPGSCPSHVRKSIAEVRRAPSGPSSVELAVCPIVLKSITHPHETRRSWCETSVVDITPAHC